MLRIKVSVAGERQIDLLLSRVAHRVSDFTPVWRRLGVWFFDEAMPKQFDSEGDFMGGRWSSRYGHMYGPWKEDLEPGQDIGRGNVGARKAKGSVHPVLYLTGRLRRSLTDPSHPESIFRVKNLEFSFGTKVPYALDHQLGEGVPVRKIIAFEGLGKMVNKLLARWMQEWAFNGEIRS